ncbi:cytochrome P450 [Colletotrichum karsti]|uniref:Cytochrome P450 n=1 Tax=Colletotrichum karsti TaxID=1095194 RepID=A0A9P6I569_9PEZI|nr:cytochrome P450 [Colletotrichum karsti]KAF9874206.1 cytochrome P450 [Colletotrichum karsti]
MATANESFHSQSWGALDSLQAIPSPLEKPLPYFITVFLLFVFYVSVQQEKPRPASNVEVLQPRSKWDFTGLKVKYDFAVYGRAVLIWRARQEPDEAYQVITETGEMTILPPVPYANEIRNHEDLSFDRVLDKNFHAHLPGFEPLRETNPHKQVLKQVIRTRLTQFLAKLTAPMTDETTRALTDIIGDEQEWKRVVIKENMVKIVARVSTRIFGGEDLARNEKWLKITSEYARTSFFASELLRMFPKSLRAIVHQLNPISWKLMGQVRDARRIINPIVEKRRQEKKAAEDADEEEPEYNDCLEWCEEASEDTVADPAVMQLGLSFAAIHTTADMVTQAMIDLARNPEYFEPLRKEIGDCLRTDGWAKLGLYKMKVLDSVCKEVQRMNPISLAAMHREATKPVKLSNGIELPEGARITVSCQQMWNPHVYPDPQRFDGYRYLRLRERLGAGKEGAAHFVSTSPEHLGFGHGQHACPGRFFAANEIKIILCHMLMKYDWRLAPDCKPRTNTFGLTNEVDRKAMIEIRRRDVEVEVKA